MDIPRPPEVKISPEAWAMLVDEYCRGNPLRKVIAHLRAYELWDAHRDHILAEWVARSPGTRPNRWWLNDRYGEQRQQLGGQECKGFYTRCGIPEASKGAKLGVPDTVAVFESQAVYLLRNNLLFPGELERLTPADFAPVSVPIVFSVG
jgi:hypothetical protein